MRLPMFIHYCSLSSLIFNRLAPSKFGKNFLLYFSFFREKQTFWWKKNGKLKIEHERRFRWADGKKKLRLAFVTVWTIFSWTTLVLLSNCLSDWDSLTHGFEILNIDRNFKILLYFFSSYISLLTISIKEENIYF